MNGLAIYNPQMNQEPATFGLQPPIGLQQGMAPQMMPQMMAAPMMVPSAGNDAVSQLSLMNQQEAQRQRESSNIIGAAQKVANAVTGSKDTGNIMKPMQLVTSGGQKPASTEEPEAETSSASEEEPQAMAGGGIAKARQVQSEGRGNDTMLVHMTPREVRGLQAIAMAHGGSLTINPETGLIEAGFLDSILPMAAGAALAATGVGAPMAALMVGGGTALMTGSLEKGLFAGLGAFGGAGLGSGLMAAGTAPAEVGTTAGLGASGAEGAAAAIQSAGQTAVPGALQTGGAKYLQAAGTQMIPQGAASVAPGATQSLVQSAATPLTFTERVGQMGEGVKKLFTPEDAPGAFKRLIGSSEEVDKQTGQVIQKATGLGGTMGAVKTAGALAAPFIAQEIMGQDEGGLPKPKTYIRPYSFDYQKTSEVDPNFKYRTGEKGESTGEQRYFTPTYTSMGVFEAGTEPGGSFYGTPTAEQYSLYSKPKDSPLGLAAGGIAGLGKGGLKDGAFVVPADVVSHLGNGSNDAGQKLLARGLGARPIKGKGDGMSDSIRTSIEGKQPALVADGEAYIPPEVVKKVGVKRLYNMMSKIRKARTGTHKQAPEVDAKEFMPA
jgi:hypothetical protein